MKRSARQCCVLVLALLCRVPSAHADGTMVVDEPAVQKQPTTYNLQVLDDGFARLHLKWGDPHATGHQADLSLSTFKADGQPPAIVGLGGGKEGAESLLPYLQNVELSANRTEIRLAGAGLISDVKYAGTLSATVDKRETLVWDITLIRPGAVAPFRCPVGPQT